ncbi:MAG: DUF3085 domain-containing protein [Gilliamella sp.]|uniref:DUF3085 domain-containing protein n=1 Tax=Gilliamella sp. TaxID=1891236 RepID=UPI0025EF968E|nr:DUF3085 domain-containing protein [Gilliamella sp.]MCO6545507.1 DUF3085 domain-containing protein [Gilliamella sp.]MCO6548271.1 DUF3085 domain-containing protein [Gilliamella sp.]
MQFLFKSSELIPIIQLARKNKTEILFVRDHGVYLMVSVNDANTICYAENCNPDIDENWYLNSRTSLDGDDFGEYFDPFDTIFSKVIK